MADFRSSGASCWTRGDPGDTLVDVTRARTELGWSPQVSSAGCAREQISGLADGTAALGRDRLREDDRSEVLT